MEYVLVLAASVCVLVGLGAILDVLSSGLVLEHALASASHHAQANAGWLLDVLAY